MVWEIELIVGGMKRVSEQRKNVLPKEQLNEMGHMIRVEYAPDDSPGSFLSVWRDLEKALLSQGLLFKSTSVLESLWSRNLSLNDY